MKGNAQQLTKTWTFIKIYYPSAHVALYLGEQGVNSLDFINITFDQIQL